MINLILFVYLFIFALCLDCTLNKDTFLINEEINSVEQFSITNRGEQNISIYISPTPYFLLDSSQHRISGKSSATVSMKFLNTKEVYNGMNIFIYCYNIHNPDDNQILSIKVVNDRNICTEDDFEIVESECNDDSKTTVSYRYKVNCTCEKIPLPQNETVYCYNKERIKPAAIALYVFFGIIASLWFYTVYNVVKLFWIYLQYLPPHFIVGFALGTVLISLYEAALTFVDNSSNCLAILIVGAFGHTLHSTCACSTATYMYYEKMKTLIIKNNWIYLSIRLTITLILEFTVFAIAYHYHYGFGREVKLLSGLTYTIPICNNNPLYIIYILPV